MRLFKNRMHAAQELSENLAYLASAKPVVVGLANAGVPIAEIVARNLKAPFDVIVIEKLFVPKYPNQCVGAVDEHGRICVVHGSQRWHNLTAEDLQEPAQGVLPELQRRHADIRMMLPEADVHDRMVILLDEGVASGAKMLGAIGAMKERGAAKIIVAAPAGASHGIWQLHAQADEVFIAHRPTKFTEFSHFYEEYEEVTDRMVAATIETWVADHPPDHGGVKTVVLKLRNSRGQPLMCEIDLPLGMQRGARYPVVVFAHGFESSARSRRSMAISEKLARRGVVGARLDFTGHGRSGGSVQDATERQMRDDLRSVIQAVTKLKEVDKDRVAIIGSGTGAMVSLQYAEDDPSLRALVLRGPVCNLDNIRASAVQAPTLVIHADDDTALLNAVETLDRELAAQHKLVRIAHTNRMFSDSGCMNRMVNTTVEWLVEQLLGEIPLATDGQASSDAARTQAASA